MSLPIKMIFRGEWGTAKLGRAALLMYSVAVATTIVFTRMVDGGMNDVVFGEGLLIGMATAAFFSGASGYDISVRYLWIFASFFFAYLAAAVTMSLPGYKNNRFGDKVSAECDESAEVGRTRYKVLMDNQSTFAKIENARVWILIVLTYLMAFVLWDLMVNRMISVDGSGMYWMGAVATAGIGGIAAVTLAGMSPGYASREMAC